MVFGCYGVAGVVVYGARVGVDVGGGTVGRCIFIGCDDDDYDTCGDTGVGRVVVVRVGYVALQLCDVRWCCGC